MSSIYETKKRELVFEPVRVSRDQVYFQGQLASSNQYPSNITGRQTTTSRNNGNYKDRKLIDKMAREGTIDAKKFAGAIAFADTADNGGDFETTRHVYEGTRLEGRIRQTIPSWSYSYDGPVFAYSSAVGPTSTVWPVPPSDLYSQMIGKGATAISRTIPTNPTASTAQALGELREGLPSLPGRSFSRKGFKASGDELLNYEFGIKPLVSDLQKISTAATTFDKRVAQLKRDSGRLIRRGYSFPVERTTSPDQVIQSAWAGSPALRTGSTGAYPSATGKLTKSSVTEVKTWFSGAYTYFYPDGDRAVDKMGRAASNLRATYGLDVNPELLWELTPWSWAIDWVTNMGDVMSNISRLSRDNLVMKWGYVMCTWKRTDTYTLVGQPFNGVGSPTLSQSFTTIVKKRVRATPYGFALDPAKFTTTQWAILGGLGLSRGQGQL